MRYSELHETKDVVVDGKKFWMIRLGEGVGNNLFNKSEFSRRAVIKCDDSCVNKRKIALEKHLNNISRKELKDFLNVNFPHSHVWDAPDERAQRLEGGYRTKIIRKT